MSLGEPAKFIMPVDQPDAVLQMNVEALRQVITQLERLNTRDDEKTKLLHSMDNRLTKIESNKLERVVTEHEKRIDALESKDDRREGALSFGAWLVKAVPWAVGAAVLAVVGKLLGVGT